MEPADMKFCRVCLELEQDVKHKWIFSEGARIAKMMYNLTGVPVVDVHFELSALVCEQCEKNLKLADDLRKRILDTHEYLLDVLASSEIEMIEGNLEELKRQVAERPQIDDFETEPFDLDDQINFNDSPPNNQQNLLIFNEDQENPATDDSDEELIKSLLIELEEPTCVEVSPTKPARTIFTARKSTNPRVRKRKSSSKENSGETSKKKKKSYSRNEIQERSENVQKMSFQCGTCEAVYFSSKELDNHLLTHTENNDDEESQKPPKRRRTNKSSTSKSTSPAFSIDSGTGTHSDEKEEEPDDSVIFVPDAFTADEDDVIVIS